MFFEDVMRTNDKILITGSNGVLGYGLKKVLRDLGYLNLLTPSRRELDLLKREDVLSYIEQERPDYVFHLASVVYGLKGNTRNQWKALTENTVINHNLFQALVKWRPRKIFYAGTVASYPYPSKNPLDEKDFFGANPHWGEFGYATSKRYAYSYLEIMRREFGVPYCYGLFTNLFGPCDRFNAETGHVIPSLIVKASRAVAEKSPLVVWGNPQTTRDFLFSYDAAQAAVMCMKKGDGIINIASGEAVTIGEIVDHILTEFPGLNSEWDSTEPVGISNRSVRIDRLSATGWKAGYSLQEALRLTIDWFKLQSEENLRC